MKWKWFSKNTKRAKEYRLTHWHDWFAWYPVRIDYLTGYKIVWLETVSRKGVWLDFWHWNYKVLER